MTRSSPNSSSNTHLINPIPQLIIKPTFERTNLVETLEIAAEKWLKTHDLNLSHSSDNMSVSTCEQDEIDSLRSIKNYGSNANNSHLELSNNSVISHSTSEESFLSNSSYNRSCDEWDFDDTEYTEARKVKDGLQSNHHEFFPRQSALFFYTDLGVSPYYQWYYYTRHEGVLPYNPPIFTYSLNPFYDPEIVLEWPNYLSGNLYSDG